MEHDEAVRIARTILEYNGLKVSSLDATQADGWDTSDGIRWNEPGDAVIKVPTFYIE